MIEQIFGLIISVAACLAIGAVAGLIAGLIACIFVAPVVFLICWILDRLV